MKKTLQNASGKFGKSWKCNRRSGLWLGHNFLQKIKFHWYTVLHESLNVLKLINFRSKKVDMFELTQVFCFFARLYISSSIASSPKRKLKLARVDDKAAMQNFAILRWNGPLIMLGIQKFCNNQPFIDSAPKKSQIPPIDVSVWNKCFFSNNFLVYIVLKLSTTA
jgi:hypothetical protein